PQLTDDDPTLSKSNLPPNLSAFCEEHEQSPEDILESALDTEGQFYLMHKEAGVVKM
ncbi:hypothetical protein FRB98_005176, partial [Tulasnella sp. 332]